MPFRARRPVAALATTLLAGGAVLALGAAPALAVPPNVETPNMFWWNVSSDGIVIVDAWSSYDDFLGTGVDFPQGFTGDAFDSFLSGLEGHYNGMDVPVALTPVSSDWQDDALTTITAAGHADFGNGRELFIDITLQIEGNYASWTFGVSSLPGATVTAEGDLGSDDDTVAIPLSATTLVTHDLLGSDPIIGYQVEGAGASLAAADDDEVVRMTFPAGGSSRLVLALQDYSPCTRDEAIAEMTARAPSLISTFGQVIGLPDALDCVSIADPAAFSVGVATDQQLAVTVDPLIAAYVDDLIQDGELRLATAGLPSGLSLAIDPVTRALRLTGAAPQGTYPVQVVLYAQSGGNNYWPYAAMIDVTVEPASAPQLADSGASEATPVLAVVGVLMLLAGGAAVAVRRRVARR